MRLPALSLFRKENTTQRRSLLRREIAAMLAVKMLVLYGIWNAFFSNPVLPKMIEGMDPARVAAVIISTTPTANH